MNTNTTTTAASGAAFQPEALRLADALQNAPLWESQAPLIAGFRADDDATLEEAAAELRRLHALTTAAPAAQEAEPATETPEGCTPADAQILRKANHDLAAESFELQAVLRGIVDQAGKALARFDIAFQEDAVGLLRKMRKWYGNHATLHYLPLLAQVDDLIAAAPRAPAAPTAAAGAYAPLPKPYSAAAALGLDDLYTGDDMRAYADAHRAAPAPAAGAAPSESRTDHEREADEYTIHRMGHLLAEIAVIVKGAERARHRHGYDDLPALVMELAAFRDLHRGSAGAAPTDAEGARVVLQQMVDALQREVWAWAGATDNPGAAPEHTRSALAAGTELLARWGAAAPAQEADEKKGGV